MLPHVSPEELSCSSSPYECSFLGTYHILKSLCTFNGESNILFQCEFLCIEIAFFI